MKLLYYSLAVYLCFAPASAASKRQATEKPAPNPCTVVSPTTGRLFDLNELSIPKPENSKLKSPRTWSWNTTGYDIGYNFTLNFCAPVLENIKDVVGVERELWKNVSAFYRHRGQYFSLGYVHCSAGTGGCAYIPMLTKSQIAEFGAGDARSQASSELH